MNAITLHKKLEENAGLLIFGILFVASLGGLVQVLPVLYQESLQTASKNTVPYSPIALQGRDIYIREGCHVCHSQQIRPLMAEVKRYGPYSRAGEFVYDRPFMWGSKRTGPDLHRIGGKYSDIWHRVHLLDPRSVVNNSIMPAYPWLENEPASNAGDIQEKMRTLVKLGHPYTKEEIDAASASLEGVTELDALIVYLQGLGATFVEETELEKP